MTPLEAQQAAARVMARCDELAAISTEPDRLTRLYLSAEHRRANHRVGEWMRERHAGLAGQRRQYLRPL